MHEKFLHALHIYLMWVQHLINSDFVFRISIVFLKVFVEIILVLKRHHWLNFYYDDR